MKKAFFLFFFLFGGIALFCQNQYEGIWQLVDQPEEKVSDPLNQPDIYQWSFTDSTKSDTNFRTLYFACPNYIVWNQHDICLIYGDIYDNTVPIISRKYSLKSMQGDCVFYWVPQTSMYEYLATWVNDHFVYYNHQDEGSNYEKVDPEVLTQRQKELLQPAPEDAVYWQGRLRPIEPYYHCNIPSKN